MDSIPSAPTIEENSSSRTPVRQVFLEKRKKDEEGEGDHENDVAMKEINEQNEDKERLDRGSIRSSPRDGLSTPYRLTME